MDIKKAKLKISTIIILAFCLILFLAVTFSLKYDEVIVSNASSLPVITISTDEWSKKVMVSITYPDTVENPKYKRIWQGNEYAPMQDYIGSFEVNVEGETEVRAYYDDTNFVSKLISNIDVTAPQIHISLDVNLMTQDNILLVVKADDSKSGVENVRISTYDYHLTKKDDVYILDLSKMTVGESFVVEAIDRVGNIATQAFRYTVYEYVSDIRRMSERFLLLEESKYTTKLWAELIINFRALEMAFIAPEIDTAEINRLELEIGKQIEGTITYSTILKEPLVGMDSNIRYGIAKEDIEAKKGSHIIMQISNVVISNEQRAEYERTLTTLASYTKARVFPFSVTLKERSGEDFKLTGKMNIEFTVPDGYKDVKLFHQYDGLFEEYRMVGNDNKRSTSVDGDGVFFVVANESTSINASLSKGYIIKGKFYSYGLFWGVIGGCFGFLLIVFVVTFLSISSNNKKNKLSHRLTRKK